MRSERSIVLKLLRFAKKHKLVKIKIITASESGYPDYIFCINGKFVAIETKSTIGLLSPLQRYRQKEIERAGGKYFVYSDNFNLNKILIDN